MRIRNLILAAICFSAFALTASAQDERFMIHLRRGVGFSPDGYVQVRENSVLGEKLELDGDLGIDQFDSYSFGLGINLGSDWLDLQYTSYKIDGEADFPKSFNYNGAIYEPGSTDIERTTYYRIEALYRHTLEGSRNALEYSSLHFGLLMETLSFYIDGELDPSSTRTEKFENFDRQKFPVPEVGVRLQRPLHDSLGAGFELTAGWLPRVNTIWTRQSN